MPNPDGVRCTCVLDHDGAGRIAAAGVGAGFCDAGFFCPHRTVSSLLSSDSVRQAESQSNPCTVEPSHMCANKEIEVAFCEI